MPVSTAAVEALAEAMCRNNLLLEHFERASSVLEDLRLQGWAMVKLSPSASPEQASLVLETAIVEGRL